MVYGFISRQDSELTELKFRGKRISQENVITNYEFGRFMKCLQRGDVVYVMSVNRFSSVRQLLVFGRFCKANGVTLHVIEQPYLDLTDGKNWKDSTVWQMERMIAIEEYAKAHLQRNFRMGKEQWEMLYQTLEIMNLEILAHTYSPDGILKRSK